MEEICILMENLTPQLLDNGYNKKTEKNTGKV